MLNVRGIAPRRFPYAWLCLVLGSAGFLLHLIPGLDPGFIARYDGDAAFALVVGVVTYAMLQRARKATGFEERRLWGWLGASFGLWTLAQLTVTLSPGVGARGISALGTDLLLFCSYSAWFLGVNYAPHHPSGWTRRQPGWRFEQLGTAVVSLGLALDLAILPRLAAPRNEPLRMFADGLFVAFDVVILLRLLALVGRASAPAWRRWYGAVAAMAAGILVMEIISVGMGNALLPTYSGPLYDLAWNVPLVILAAACSLPTPQPAPATRALDVSTGKLDEGVSPLEGGLVLYTAAFIVAHLLADPFVPAAAALSRGLTAAAVILLLGWLAYLAQAGLEQRVRALSQELTRATFELAQSQKLEAIARLAAGVAHDFNNVLTVILGHGELLIRGLRDDASERRDVGRIQDAALRAARLTADLMSFGGGQRLRLRPLHLNHLLEGCTHELHALAGASVALTIQCGRKLPVVSADVNEVRAALLHLARNAIEAMPSGGRLLIATDGTDFSVDSAARPSLVPPGSYASLTVEDSGLGMDADTQARIFEPFFTTKRFGRTHGLGLAAVHGIVARHGGYSLVRSEVGRGTRFDLLFPAVNPSNVTNPGAMEGPTQAAPNHPG